MRSKRFKRMCAELARQIEADSYLTALVEAAEGSFTPPNTDEVKCFMSLEEAC